jgi:hypothetical protein
MRKSGTIFLALLILSSAFQCWGQGQPRSASLHAASNPPRGIGVPFGGLLSKAADTRLSTRDSKQLVAAKFRKAGFSPLRCEAFYSNGLPRVRLENCSATKVDATGQITDAYEFQFYRGYVTHIEWRFNSQQYKHYLAEAIARYGPTGKGAMCDQGAAAERLTDAQIDQCVLTDTLWLIHGKDGRCFAEVTMNRSNALGGSVARVKDDWPDDEFSKLMHEQLKTGRY